MKYFLMNLLLFVGLAQAQTVELIMPYPAGGPTDTFARQLQKELFREQSLTAVITHRPGADGKVAAQEFLNTSSGTNKILMVATGTSLFYKLTRPIAPGDFDPLADLDLIGPILTVNATISVPPQSKIMNLEDFFAAARTGIINCGTSNTGSEFFIQAVKAKEKLNINIVPFKGSSPTTVALLGQHIDCAVDAVPQVLPFYRNNQMRVIAISNTDRFIQAPIIEFGTYRFDSFFAIALPRTMDPALRSRIVSTVMSLPSSQEFVSTMSERGFTISKASTNFSQMLQGKYQNLVRLRSTFAAK